MEINQLPINGKFKEKIMAYLLDRPLEKIHLGDFAKWEGGGECAVCGHSLMWSYRNGSVDIGICCAKNILALKQCNGNFDELNFKRELVLAKKTIYKHQKLFEQKQQAIVMEARYNNEFLFCKQVLDLVWSDSFFEPYCGQRDGDRYLYANPMTALIPLYAIESFISYLEKGIVNEYYLKNIHTIMQKTPAELISKVKNEINETKKRLAQYEEKQEIEKIYFNKIMQLSKINIGRFDIPFIQSLKNFYYEKEFYTENQKQAIDKLLYKYRNQPENKSKEKG